MPLSTSPSVVETSTGLVSALRGAAGDAPKSFRPAHAKGHLLTGTFTPTPQASSLTTAPHFHFPSTPLTIRFSSSTGLPHIPDTEPTSNPRGIAIRFHLPTSPSGRRHHTDVIAHSTPYFPTRTGAEFLHLLQILGAGEKGKEELDAFLRSHPETVRFLQDPKPSPESFATQRYWGVNAYRFVAEGGKEVFGRYRVLPAAGVHTLSAEELTDKSPDYLFEELPERLEKGPVVFKLVVQVAAPGDGTDDATVIWPEDREVVELGEVQVEGWVKDEESMAEQKKIIFDPIPRVEGIEASADPLLDVRASVYLISGRERREAKE
jgi:catalase